ncbi:hypothetical protein OHD55_29715 [Escherichia coli]|nr:hypothetical protein [Escherichia coli]
MNHTRLSAFWTREEAVLTTQKTKICAGAHVREKQNSVSHCRWLFGEDRQG